MDITRETFSQMDSDSKLNVLFDYAVNASEVAKTAYKSTEEIKEVCRRHKKFESGTAGLMGFVGGLVGFFSQKIFFK